MHTWCFSKWRDAFKLALSTVISVSMIVAFVQHSFPAGQIITDTITSEALKDNKLGDPHTRNMTIYLPPGYASSDKIYPVIYLLHGFGGDERSLVDEIGEELAVLLVDGMIASGMIKEIIAVMPDASNKYGGSFYLNSELTGNYEDYMVHDLVDYIDSNYRTIRDRDARAIGGASMGGYGSITLAMKHPDIFSSVVSLSPPLGFDIISQEMIAEVIRENPDGMPDPGSDAKQYTEYVYALSAALSPDLNDPPFFIDLPFEYPSGEIIESVRQRWMNGDPMTMLATYGQSLRELKGIYIDVGDDDLLGFKAAADAFHQELISMGIEHEYNVYHGTHYDKAAERFINALKYLSDRLPISQQVCRIDMEPGWNVISLYVQPLNTDIDSVLDSIHGQYESAWSYRNPGWLWYYPDAVVPQTNTLREIESGTGYWIMVNGQCSLITQGGPPVTAIPLDIGWNLVGYSSRTPRSIEECMASIDGNYNSVWEYDPNEGWFWYIPAAPESSNLRFMTQGKGYLIEATAPCTWDINGTASPATTAASSETSHIAADAVEILPLQNYPNPFNPDTWIPFQLKGDANVVINIHDAAGRLVRTLDLGYKSAGYYIDKERAAYWDGRNEAGEHVASGVYFYSTRSGNHIAIRKMIVVQ